MNKTKILLVCIVLSIQGFSGISQNCFDIQEITCDVCDNGIIDVKNDPIKVKFCVNEHMTHNGSNWLHSVFLNSTLSGFDVQTLEGTSNLPTNSDGFGTWSYSKNPAFTSDFTGNMITQSGWYYDRTPIDLNPGNSTGDRGANDSISQNFCFEIMTKSAAELGITEYIDSVAFGFTSDSYSGAWTNTACGLETPSNNFVYKVTACPVIANAGPDQTLCAGTTTTLSAAASIEATSYLWSTGDTTTTITVSPQITTTYVVTAKSANCSKMDSVTIRINDLEVDAGPDINLCNTFIGATLNGNYSTTFPATKEKTFKYTTTIVIPDNNEYGEYLTLLSDLENGTLEKVCVNILHNYVNDVGIRLSCPDGTSLLLSENNGGSGDNYDNVCFTRVDSININSLSSITVPSITGNWLPENSLSGFDSCNSNGNWVLNVRDTVMFSQGQISGWDMTFKEVIPPVVSWKPTTYLSDTNSLTPTFINPGIGTYTYTLTVTDDYCEKSDVIVINVLAPEPDAIVTHTSCVADTGSIGPISGCGVLPFSYLWFNGDTSASVSGLAAGSYSVTVTNGSGATYSNQYTVNYSDVPQLSAVFTQLDCFGQNSASIDLTAITNNPPLSYSWSNGASTEDLSQIGPGTYSVIVTDNQNCNSIYTDTIYAPSPVISTYLTQDASCFNCPDGKLNVSVTGGSSPYSYLWSNGSFQKDSLNDLLPGIYALTVSDFKNCVHEIDSMIVSFPSLVLSKSFTEIKIFPNPVSDYLYLSIINPENNRSEVWLTTIDGRAVPTTFLERRSNGNALIKIDISNLPNQMYLISVQDGNTTYFDKFIKYY